MIHPSIDTLREQFPVLHQQINGKPFVYFDNAATSQKPQRVIDALTHYYQYDNANIHRGIHTLAERATNAFEETRKAAAHFINANEPEEVIITKGTTEGINLVAQAYGRKFLKEGDEILISEMEHHSNIVPWQLLCKQTGAVLRIIPINDQGELMMDRFAEMVGEKTKIVSVVYISNSLGTINPVEEIIQKAHAHGATVVIDAAQAAPHLQLDVKRLNCDFLALSGHKMYGPTGVGILYGKRSFLEKMDPYQGGGEMIRDVTFENTTFNDIPYKFEAGTPNIADVVAFREAFRFISEIGIENIAARENELLQYGTTLLGEIKGLTIIGQAKQKASVISFIVEGVHPFDLGILLDTKGIAIRTGHHCTQPLMTRYGIEGTARASFAVYNTTEEIDRLANGLKEIVKKFTK
ncbi:MAG: cysteine desulfurase [Cyclobacteriaceae bacterium]|nr:cysteine desulfurase [Cyclobacteriaceae bacterium]